jgi:hypothetical protein
LGDEPDQDDGEDLDDGARTNQLPIDFGLSTGEAPPFGQGVALRKIGTVTAWIEPYAELYQDYCARLAGGVRL